MASCQSPVDDDVSAFFKRCGLPRDTRLRCLALARRAFPEEKVEETRPQGYCSYTLCVGRDTLVQFRPTVHKLDIRVTAAAENTYGSLAPQTKFLDLLDVAMSCPNDECGDSSHQRHVDEAVVIDDGYYKSAASLHVYSLSRIPGLSVAELRDSRAQSSWSQAVIRRQREDVIRNFARFIVIGWKSARRVPDPTVSSIRGRVGGSIRWRLREMRAHLPQRFQPAVKDVLERLDVIESLPWVLTHGDVVPANMMVRESSGALGGLDLTGFLDWAEAEYLPFGVGLYGLEALLGEPAGNGRFTYYPEAGELRKAFWLDLEAEIPELGIESGSDSFRRTVEAAQALGVLLWHGIAFDNGRLDRVVDERNPEDAEEVRILDLFLVNKEEDNYGQVDPGHPVEPAGSVSIEPLDLGRAFSDVWASVRRQDFGDRRIGKF
ncbi:hypothetical protein diail_1124 [Diaporthe ilicicola]|nr:hypothetical protein diail_1124 [Diaporthe ilicicola]